MTAPVRIDTAPDWGDSADRLAWEQPGDRKLVVNRADRGDTNVVLSFDVRGKRDAIGVPPAEAIKLAAAILAAVNAIDEGDEAFHVRMAAQGQTDPEGALAAIDARYHDHLPEGQNCHLCGVEHSAINSREA